MSMSKCECGQPLALDAMKCPKCGKKFTIEPRFTGFEIPEREGAQRAREGFLGRLRQAPRRQGQAASSRRKEQSARPAFTACCACGGRAEKVAEKVGQGAPLHPAPPLLQNFPAPFDRAGSRDTFCAFTAANARPDPQIRNARPRGLPPPQRHPRAVRMCALREPRRGIQSPPTARFVVRPCRLRRMALPRLRVALSADRGDRHRLLRDIRRNVRDHRDFRGGRRLARNRGISAPAELGRPHRTATGWSCEAGCAGLSRG